MRIEKKDISNYILDVTISAGKHEFDDARKKAYIENTDRYAVPGTAAGMAAVDELEKLYGPAVLYDEALEKIVPELFGKFLDDECIRITGKPEMYDMQFENGGVNFSIKAYMYPDIEPGQYRDICVPFRRSGEQEQFEKAVLQKACENMKGEIPPHMIEQKLDSVIAREKMNIAGEAIYHLLADALVILKDAYNAAGVARPLVQIRREAMDLMLQTVSEEHVADWRSFFREEITVMAERYHGLPDDFARQLDDIIEKRVRGRSEMKQDDLIDEVFSAYLGSLELTEEQWRNQRRLQAAKEVCLDLLLDAVASEEKLEVSDHEVREAVESIAAQCSVEPEEAEAGLDIRALEWKLLRDKAAAVVIDSAKTDEELRSRLAAERKNMGSVSHS